MKGTRRQMERGADLETRECVGGIAVASRRLLAVVFTGLGVALAGAAPAVWVVTQRITAQSVLSRLTGATPESSRAVYDALTSQLLDWLLIAAGVGLATAAAAWLANRLLVSNPAETGFA